MKIANKIPCKQNQQWQKVWEAITNNLRECSQQKLGHTTYTHGHVVRPTFMMDSDRCQFVWKCATPHSNRSTDYHHFPLKYLCNSGGCPVSGLSQRSCIAAYIPMFWLVVWWSHSSCWLKHSYKVVTPSKSWSTPFTTAMSAPPRAPRACQAAGEVAEERQPSGRLRWQAEGSNALSDKVVKFCQIPSNSHSFWANLTRVWVFFFHARK